MFHEYPYINLNDLNLDYVLKKLKAMIEDVDTLTEWKAEHEAEYQQLKHLYDQIISGNFPKSIIDAFENWMRRNADDLVGEMVKNVFFGLTDSGYFVAYIPESWDDITFNTTGLDIEVALMPDYGHLVLSY